MRPTYVTFFHLSLQSSANVGPVMDSLNGALSKLPAGPHGIFKLQGENDEYVFAIESNVFLTRAEYHDLFESIASLPGVDVLYTYSSYSLTSDYQPTYIYYLAAETNYSFLKIIFGGAKQLTADLKAVAQKHRGKVQTRIERLYRRFFVTIISDKSEFASSAGDEIHSLLFGSNTTTTAQYKNYD